jgi:phosphatidylinositol alpha-1,6-mannosyltransferase
VRAPLLAAITLHQSGGGIALVSSLLRRALVERWQSDTYLVTMFDHENHPATFSEKARFAMSVRRRQVLDQTDWVLFSHFALARVQQFVPSSYRRPYGVFVHGIEVWNDLTAREKQLLARADIRLANSRYTADRVMGRHPDLGVVVPCPLALPPADRFHGPESVSPPRQFGPHAVLVVGRMLRSERYKGHDQLIDAWPAIVARVPDATLVIVGTGDDVGRLRAKARCGSVPSQIAFTGFVSTGELDALYQAAAIFALPSRGEGFGLVYLEAMAHRLPCIGSIHDAAGDVIVDGITGCLVDQDDGGALAEAISALLLNESRRKTMGAAGFKRVSEEFTYDRFSQRLHTLLAHIDGSASAHSRSVVVEQ